ncbi:glycoside hydrolase family protein [Thermosynechococcaceae cyanobacterium BACA0444]|uniref:Glycoside hydrolase family protein n=1 Tax=Pseudocalidococcus azoricus BACA0444 TaxID=2918990 RepID=A0AAE4FPS6_9CYAN|nr:glycoside hydrolase family protein [Pseudocalidococcus azoricus]MDS3860043.1 glycoside hydrolase family protein [Pseudocalidococcus azoricus BACA0444]
MSLSLQKRSGWLWFKLWPGLVIIAMGVVIVGQPDWARVQALWRKWQPGEVAPLAMRGGDPYVRALMRTISVSEANDPSPYTLLYGGDHIQDLNQHPDRCLPILRGPNQGQCTTAAGRYQFLTSTWDEKAAQYHPVPPNWLWSDYNFAPEYQDQVVYRWLTDTQAWGADIPQLLREGHIQQVLALLSTTWTSLGYGIEDNVMTPGLEKTYWQLLDQELKRDQTS